MHFSAAGVTLRISKLLERKLDTRSKFVNQSVYQKCCNSKCWVSLTFPEFQVYWRIFEQTKGGVAATLSRSDSTSNALDPLLHLIKGVVFILTLNGRQASLRNLKQVRRVLVGNNCEKFGKDCSNMPRHLTDRIAKSLGAVN